MASGDTLLVYLPVNSEGLTTVQIPSIDERNNHPVLDYDDSANEGTIFTAVMPQNYANGGITILWGYSMTSAVTGDTVWRMVFERIGDEVQDVDSDSFAGGFTTGGLTVPATSGHVKTESRNVAHSLLDGVVSGDLFRIKTERLGANGSDTAVGDAELHYIEIREQ